MTRILWLILVASLLLSIASGQVSESLKRREKSDITKLARITRADHSTIFFCGVTDAGYVRDGEIYSIVLEAGNLRYLNYCFGQAVSRDGSRIAYGIVTKAADGCRIVIRDLKTAAERDLALTEKCSRLLTWSWDDSEIAYQGVKAIFALSVADGSKRLLGQLPLRIDGKIPSEGWSLQAIDWLHHRAEPVLDAEVCVPTSEPGTCVNQHQVLLLFRDDSRALEIGECNAVSPVDDSIAFIAHNTVWVVNIDGSIRRAVTTVPSTLFFLPFLKEEPWLRIVWSPRGDRLWFHTIVSDEGATNVYLVDVRTGHRQQILKSSTISITDWRQSSPIPPINR
jgi:hypothetical protein